MDVFQPANPLKLERACFCLYYLHKLGKCRRSSILLTNKYFSTTLQIFFYLAMYCLNYWNNSSPIFSCEWKNFLIQLSNGIIFLQPDIPFFLLLLRRVFKNLNGSVSQKYSHHYHSESNQPSFYLIANTIWNSNEVELICRPAATKWNIPHLRRLPWNLFIPSKENYFSLRHSNNGIYGSWRLLQLLWLRPIIWP